MSLWHAPLGVLALGQLPSTPAGDAAAAGAILSLSLTLVAGAASAEGQFPPIVIGSGRHVFVDAFAPGATLDLWVSLVPGRALGIVGRRLDAMARGAALPRTVSLMAGSATGDGATAYDNDLLVLLAA